MHTRQLRIYISGPITGCPQLNRPAFDAAAALIREAGFQPVNPFDVIDQERAAAEGWQWSDYMRVDIAALCECDAIMMLEGWMFSDGAKLEQSIANALGMPKLWCKGSLRIAMQRLSADKFLTDERMQSVSEAITRARLMQRRGEPHTFNLIELLNMSGPRSHPRSFDLIAHLYRQIEFSKRTFGPGERLNGVLDHIRKELVEVEKAGAYGIPTLPEWVDVIILALDGAWRSGATPEQIAAAIDAKQTRNEARRWPDWRTADPSKAIEHDRGADGVEP